ncbi:hypothetical protein SAMN04489718_0084 [Actinopolyspora saharensis]|uniref:Uncharacterized protein n=1 Tax=Actinopolyspora saharensis TaxID=995062 RepID=A0A1H0XXH8_9ACTN|nr:hypothetical protein SAMN04489718_0084 [Actinopolyspora saharensis]
MKLLDVVVDFSSRAHPKQIGARFFDDSPELPAQARRPHRAPSPEEFRPPEAPPLARDHREHGKSPNRVPGRTRRGRAGGVGERIGRALGHVEAPREPPPDERSPREEPDGVLARRRTRRNGWRDRRHAPRENTAPEIARNHGSPRPVPTDSRRNSAVTSGFAKSTHCSPEAATRAVTHSRVSETSRTRPCNGATGKRARTPVRVVYDRTPANTRNTGRSHRRGRDRLTRTGVWCRLSVPPTVEVCGHVRAVVDRRP